MTAACKTVNYPTTIHDRLLKNKHKIHEMHRIIVARKPGVTACYSSLALRSLHGIFNHVKTVKVHLELLKTYCIIEL